ERVNNISDSSVRNIVQIFMQKQQEQRALQIYEVLLASKPKDAVTRLDYANLLGKLCKLERAESLLSEVAALSPGYDKQLETLKNQYEQSCNAKK
ncbi:MAG: tetratricopeptide repeat protein, partial [bacterium]|nr:tetratricopeptide repeat protein [bacterium]